MKGTPLALAYPMAAGVPVSYNAAQFLGHLPGRRGARGPVRIGPGTLLVIDEASMLSGPDLADLIAYAKARGAKIILAGDTSQLQAVENGGGIGLVQADPAGIDEAPHHVGLEAREELQQIFGENYTVSDKIETILARVSEGGALKFSELFAEMASRVEIVVTFLALLELIRLKQVRAIQPGVDQISHGSHLH